MSLTCAFGWDFVGSAPAGACGYCGASRVGVGVAVGVLDPRGWALAEGHLYQPAAKRGEQVQAFGQRLLDPLEAVAARHRGGVEDRDLQRVHVLGGGLHVEEPSVEPREALHDCDSGTPPRIPSWPARRGTPHRWRTR